MSIHVDVEQPLQAGQNVLADMLMLEGRHVVSKRYMHRCAAGALALQTSQKHCISATSIVLLQQALYLCNKDCTSATSIVLVQHVC